MNKRVWRGQIQLSFGMIFSIILIIIFIGFAFYAIQQFLGLQNNIKISTFYNTLQNDVNAAWTSQQTSQTKSYNMPTSIKEICFTKVGGDNLISYTNNNQLAGTHNIDNLNITAMTSHGDSCFNVTNGQIGFVLKKTFTDTLVTITK